MLSSVAFPFGFALEVLLVRVLQKLEVEPNPVVVEEEGHPLSSWEGVEVVVGVEEASYDKEGGNKLLCFLSRLLGFVTSLLAQ